MVDRVRTPAQVVAEVEANSLALLAVKDSVTPHARVNNALEASVRGTHTTIQGCGSPTCRTRRWRLSSMTRRRAMVSRRRSHMTHP